MIASFAAVFSLGFLLGVLFSKIIFLLIGKLMKKANEKIR